MHLLLLVLFSLICTNESLDPQDFYKFLARDTNSSAECEIQREAFLEGLLNGDKWAVTMLDAFGRIPQGISQGNIVDLGAFDQCVGILEELDSGTIAGRYCYAGLVLPLTGTRNSVSEKMIEIVYQTTRPVPFSDNKDTSVQFLLLAACVPDACYPSDFFEDLGIDTQCQLKDENKSLDAGDVACLSFLAIIGLLVITSTAYDILRSQDTNRILVAFSLYTNGKKIMKVNQQSGQILFFNGMKALSIFWVILGHRYALLPSFIINPTYSAEWTRKWYTAYVYTAPLSVDTFLFVSGALLSYTFLKTLRSTNQRFNVLLFYLHRYLRLTPPLAALYFVQLTVVRRISSGPLYTSMIENTNAACKENWWSLFLYVQNYVATDNMCLPHLWYLSIDMQLFVLSPLILLPMLRHQKLVSYLVIPLLTLASIVYSAVIIYNYEIEMLTADYMEKFYYLTHTRFPPCLIGIGFGAFMLDYKNNTQKYSIKNQIVKVAIWAAVLSAMTFVFFYNQDVMNNHTNLKSALFIPIQKPLWALCLAWISYVCLIGDASFFNGFLSLPIFQVISKITYSTYLVHISLLTMYLGSTQTQLYFTDFEGMRQSVADIFFALVVGAVWTLAFESPVIVIEQIVFGRGKMKEAANGSTNVNGAKRFQKEEA